MSKAPILVVIFLTATLQLANHVSSQPTSPTFSYSLCRLKSYGNYTANSTYQSNLETILSQLQSHASIEPFYNTSVGNGTDMVYGQYYCRGDLNASFCSDCIKAASLDALNCSNARAAIIWYDECTLRYKNESMFGVPEEAAVLSIYSLKNLTDPATFAPVLNDTVNGLIQEAVSGNDSSVKSFAFGQTNNVSAFLTAYYLVQCSPDLNATQCVSCLHQTFNYMYTCCGEWPLAIHSSAPSCQVGYDTRGLFYFTPNAPPPPLLTPPPLSTGSEPPPPPPQITVVQSAPPPGTGGSAMIRGSDGMKLEIITTALIFLTLVLYQ